MNSALIRLKLLYSVEIIGDPAEVVIADFGLVREGVENSYPRSITGGVGTLCYMSPECLNPRLGLLLGHPMDVFSLGLIAFQISTGEKIPMLTILDPTRTKMVSFYFMLSTRANYVKVLT